MTDNSRPDPDALLASIHKAEAKAHRGRLEIFFGMSPGVGKTYAMLCAARQKLAEGVEVVAGIVETHGRAETSALREGVPIVPRARIEHRGVVIEEMELTATEWAILTLLIRHAGRILTHPQILREVWGPKSEEHREYLRVYMTHLRKKVERDPSKPTLIVNEPGIGYRLKSP